MKHTTMLTVLVNEYYKRRNNEWAQRFLFTRAGSLCKRESIFYQLAKYKKVNIEIFYTHLYREFCCHPGKGCSKENGMTCRECWQKYIKEEYKC